MNRVPSWSVSIIVCIAACVIALQTGQARLWAQVIEPPNPFLLIAGANGTLGFGRVGTTVSVPVTKSLVLQNGGSIALGIAGVAIQGANAADFSIVSSNCGTIAAAGSCTLTVGFRPGANGTRTANLAISDNASGTPHIVMMTGWGVDPAVPQAGVGPIDPRIGFPVTYTDGFSNLELCLGNAVSPSDGVTPLCIGGVGPTDPPLPDPSLPASLVPGRPINFPEEAFWWSAGATLDIGNFKALLDLGQEAAFLNGPPVPGDQMAFGRLRIRLRPAGGGGGGTGTFIPAHTWFRFTHPYGVDEYEALPAKEGDPDGDIFVTNDIGCFSAPCDFTAPLTSRIIARFLTCQSPVAPAGYVGDPAVECTVTGSPTGFNAFKVEQITGPGGAVVSGGINGQTNLFAVTGKLRAPLPPPPPPSAVVPGIAGLLLADGLNTVVAAGFNIGPITLASSAGVAAGRIISQSPAAGGSLALPAAVSVTVSTGAGSISVPNVVNLGQSAATAAITGAGLVVGTVTTGSSATVPAGSVISQSPIAGTGVSAGSAVALLVSSGPANVTVPNVVNLAQGTATAAIIGAGLAVGTITSANSVTVAAGSVISQNPVAGTSVAPGSAVALVISSGPATATVPNVVNLAQAAASSAITGAGLAVGTITSANSVTVPAGSVISQNPVGGTVVAQGSAVALVISLGPANVAVPNVVNLTQAAATTAIVNASLVVGAITSANSATIAAGNVISQNPAAAALVAPGSAVALVISLGPAGTGPTVVASVTSAVNGRGNQTVQISTTVPTRLVAFVSADGPQNVGAGGQASTLSGGGLSWTLLARANLQFGDAEIWTADAPAALAGAAITSTLLRHRTGSDYIHLVRLVAFTGVSGIGASNVASGQTVAVASVSLNAQAAGSVIYAVGQDWTNGVTRTFPAGQVQDVQMVGADLDTFWVQRTAAPIAAAGAITFTATSATQAAPGDRWNFAIIELKR
ncbi:MAG TPA: PASTA domain-containing protein [Vicinamibacterales bacterium]|nr:PASTA domain-containing protein [Vicinamibacterales bacterium]